MSENTFDFSKIPPEKIAQYRKSHDNYKKSTSDRHIVKTFREMSFEDYVRNIWERTKKSGESRTLLKQNRDLAPLTDHSRTDYAHMQGVFKSLAEDEKFTPTARDFYRFALAYESLPLDKVRAKEFAYVPHDIWNKFLKLFFNFYHANPEQVAMDLRKTREESIDNLREQISVLKDLQAKSEKPEQKADYAKTIGVLTNQLSTISSQFAKDLGTLGLVGGKIRGGINIQIVNKIPRPAFEKKHIDVKAVGRGEEEITIE